MCAGEREGGSVCRGGACVGVCVRAWENFGGLWVDILCTVLRIKTDITLLVIFYNNNNNNNSNNNNLFIFKL